MKTTYTKLLFTGASGFLGQNILPLLSKKYIISTIGLSEIDTYTLNLSNDVPKLNQSFDIVLHAAGKAHLNPKSKEECKLFFDVNLDGTINLCSALEIAGIPKSFVFISTVAVYGVESGVNISEKHPLNGTSPYALSKIKAEEYLTKWCLKYNVKLSIIRPSLLAGSNPPGNLGAMINGIKSKRYLGIGLGNVSKSILMVEDIAEIIPKIVNKGGIFNVCDNEHPTFKELEESICRQLNLPLPKRIPYWFAKFLALVGDCLGKNAPINTSKLNKITRSLTFSNKKICKEIAWKPSNVLENFKVN